uniref:cGMP-dependent protein kinase n=1 Tax=Odontella aurita TaxID=265563 RepID=A0A7S4J9G5_9STRA
MAPNILFKACCQEEIEEIIDTFGPSEVGAGGVVIKQGNQGDDFYVLERGTIDVYELDVHVCALHSGTAFGEIALLYGCPRSATLRARVDCKLWSIDRQAFRGITGQYKRKRLQTKRDILSAVKIQDRYLKDIVGASELDAVANAAHGRSYSRGEFIVRQGEKGDIFFMIEEGDVDVFIEEKGVKPVITLKTGAFFGEKALTNEDDVRTATCVAASESVRCLCLFREDFVLMLGELQDLLDESYRHREGASVASGDASEGEGDVDETEDGAMPAVELSDLEVLRVLGEGAFGCVRLVRTDAPALLNSSNHGAGGAEGQGDSQDQDEGLFALKCLDKKKIDEHGLSDHILSEKAVMSQLKHPFIVRFYTVMQDEKQIYFLLEALLGGTLCHRIQAMGKFPEQWSKFYSASVVYAFCHMHGKRIAYRDLKPENLVMDLKGFVKIVDFGLAKKINGKTWTLCGTPDYLAPEVILNEGHDWAVDYWALGVFIYEMTAGNAPFSGANPMEVYKKVLSGQLDMPVHFSEDLVDLARKLLNTSQSKRLGRIVGGGGNVLQHMWFSDLDCDELLKMRLSPPIKPDLSEEDPTLFGNGDTQDSDTGGDVDSRLRTRFSDDMDEATADPRPGPTRMDSWQKNPKNNRVTYTLGRGNRHQQRMLEMLKQQQQQQQQHRQMPQEMPKARNEVVRSTMLRVIKHQPGRQPGAGRLSQIRISGWGDANEQDRLKVADKAVVLAAPTREKKIAVSDTKTSEDKQQALKDAFNNNSNSDVSVRRSTFTVNEKAKATNLSDVDLRQETPEVNRMTMAHAAQEGIDTSAFLKLQLMNLALASKAEGGLEHQTSFEQFSLLSLKPESLGLDNPCDESIDQAGPRYLDQFSVKSIDLLDQFPTSFSASEVEALEPEALSAFCFPNGLKIRLLPRCALQGAKRLGWFGKDSDLYQLHGFTDVSGTLSHGVSITTLELLPAVNQHTARLIAVLVSLRQKRRAAGVISRLWRQYNLVRVRAVVVIQECWRKYYEQQREQWRFSGARKRGGKGGSSKGASLFFNMNMSMANFGDTSEIIEEGATRKSGSAPRKSLKRRGSSVENKFIRSVVDIWGGGDPKQQKQQLELKKQRSRQLKKLIEMQESVRAGDGFFSWGCDDSADSDLEDDVSEAVRRQAAEAYNAMIEADRLGDVCVVEMCHVLIGTRPEEQSLLLCALQQLVDLEREDNSLQQQFDLQNSGHDSLPKIGLSEHERRPNRRLSSAFTAHSDNRHSILMAMQMKLSVPPKQSHKFRRIEFDHIYGRQDRFEMKLPIARFEPISLPMPLPHVSGQWGFAKLVLLIKTHELMLLLKLLLLERSLLIIGHSQEEVSTCCCALLDLLEPYKWASAFIPLLPIDMLDFVCSPVPFIAGIVVDNKCLLSDIEKDHRVQSSMLDGLSVLNLTTGKLLVTNEEGTAEILARAFNPISQLTLYESRLQRLYQDKKSALRSFKAFFQRGPSRYESLTLQSMKSVIKKHLQTLTASLTAQPDAWKQCGDFNEEKNTFDFDPSKFVQPLKDQLMFQIQYQEMMAHTQLFVGFVEELQNFGERRTELLVGEEALFIANWLSFRWRKFKQRLSSDPSLLK